MQIEGVRLHERALRAGLKVTRVVYAEPPGEKPSSRWSRLLADLEGFRDAA